MSVDNRITTDELYLKFPNGIPMEAAQILFGSSKEATVEEVRKQIDDWLEKNPQQIQFPARLTLVLERIDYREYVITSPDIKDFKASGNTLCQALNALAESITDNLKYITFAEKFKQAFSLGGNNGKD